FIINLNHITMRKILTFLSLGVILLMGFTSCKTVVMPYATSVEKIGTLQIGMKKAKTPELLGVYPFDIYQNSIDGCEIHHYQYRTIGKGRMGSSTTESSLTSGVKKTMNFNDLYLIYRQGSLEALFTGSGIDDGYNNLYFNGLVKEECNNDEATYIIQEIKLDTIVEESKCEYCDLIKEIISAGGGAVNVNIPLPMDVFQDKKQVVVSREKSKAKKEKSSRGSGMVRLFR
ncbi:MAG: hypothetical protein ABIJ97_17330, partial [Bacteroidota bacterium]